MRIFLLIFSTILLVIFDLFSKFFIEDYVFGTWKDICSNPEQNSFASMDYCEYDTIHLNSIFSLELSYNPGIAFSIPLSGIGLQILTLVMIIGIIFLYIREEFQKNSRIIDIGYVLILSGGLSHAFERLFIGHVVDFIAVKYFAILNFADIFISIGVFFIILSYVYSHRRSGRSDTRRDTRST